MRDSANSYRTEKAGGLATSVILQREARILEEGAAAHARKQRPVPCVKNTSCKDGELDGAAVNSDLNSNSRFNLR